MKTSCTLIGIPSCSGDNTRLTEAVLDNVTGSNDRTIHAAPASAADPTLALPPVGVSD